MRRVSRVRLLSLDVELRADSSLFVFVEQFTPTSKVDSTDLPKSSSVPTTICELPLSLSRRRERSRAELIFVSRSFRTGPSTCGVSVAFSPNSTLDSPSSQERTNKSSSRASWRCSDCRTSISSTRVRGRTSSSVSHFSIVFSSLSSRFNSPRPLLSLPARSDTQGAPRPVVNSKGKRRRPGTKTLAQVLKSDDDLFVDFIAKCLIWDPERRLKPQPALRHPWLVKQRARSLQSPAPSVAGRILNSASSLASPALKSRTHETPKKVSLSPSLRPQKSTY